MSKPTPKNSNESEPSKPNLTACDGKPENVRFGCEFHVTQPLPPEALEEIRLAAEPVDYRGLSVHGWPKGKKED